MPRILHGDYDEVKEISKVDFSVKFPHFSALNAAYFANIISKEPSSISPKTKDSFFLLTLWKLVSKKGLDPCVLSAGSHLGETTKSGLRPGGRSFYDN